MKRKELIIILLLLSLGLVSCSEDKVSTMDKDVSSLNFERVPVGTTGDFYYVDFSAIYNTQREIATVKLPIRLMGVATNYDRTYYVQVNDQKTEGNLIEGVHYSLDREQILKANTYRDSVELTVYVDRLIKDNVTGTLYVEFEQNENFSPGLTANQFELVNLVGGGLVTVPSFWGRNKLDAYGGEYLAIKAEKYIELNGIPGDSWRETNTAILYAYGKKTYLWFEENPTYDENNNRIHFKGTVEY